MTTPNPLIALSDALASAADAASRQIVRVRVGRQVASGVVWTEEGHVVTVAGAVGRATTASVTLPDGREVEAAVLGVEPGLDLAVLHAPSVPAPGERADGAALRVGELVLVVGRPTLGVRAALGFVAARSDEPWTTPLGSTVDRFLDVDAELPPGCAGGALVDARGRVVGVNTPGLVRGGTTVPADTVDAAVCCVIAEGTRERAWIGVRFEPVAVPGDGAGEPLRGLLVRGVAPDSPASRADVRIGDVLLSLDGLPLAGFSDLARALAGRVGSPMTLSALRGEARVQLPITPSEPSRRWRC